MANNNVPIGGFSKKEFMQQYVLNRASTVTDIAINIDRLIAEAEIAFLKINKSC
jgi:hypothetical protein